MVLTYFVACGVTAVHISARVVGMHTAGMLMKLMPSSQGHWTERSVSQMQVCEI